MVAQNMGRRDVPMRRGHWPSRSISRGFSWLMGPAAGGFRSRGRRRRGVLKSHAAPVAQTELGPRTYLLVNSDETLCPSARTPRLSTRKAEQ